MAMGSISVWVDARREGGAAIPLALVRPCAFAGACPLVIGAGEGPGGSDMASRSTAQVHLGLLAAARWAFGIQPTPGVPAAVLGRPAPPDGHRGSARRALIVLTMRVAA